MTFTPYLNHNSNDCQAVWLVHGLGETRVFIAVPVDEV